MNEAETRAEHIDPALAAAGWGVVEGSRNRREYPITLGRLESSGKRGKSLTADYVLEYRNTKLAVVEAKAWDKALTEGVGQAKDYAGKLAVRFTYASNGQGIYGIDTVAGVEGEIAEFPSPDALWNLTFAAGNAWRDRFAAVPFEDRGGFFQGRYYQDIAVERVLAAIAAGQERILLTLATGTGKTFFAFQLAWKLFHSRWNLESRQSTSVRPELVEGACIEGLRPAQPERLTEGTLRRPRILFLADRNILADQAYNAFSAFDDKALVRIEPGDIRKKGKVPKNGSIFFTIFQTFMSGPVNTTVRPEPVEGLEAREPTAEYQKRQKIKVTLADGKSRHIQHMTVTSFWHPDGTPMSAQQFMQALFGKLPDFFTDEDELRTLWSAPDTRKKLLEGLAERGFGKDQLSEMQKIIDAEKSDLFDVLAHVAYALEPLTREERADRAMAVISENFNSRQRVFLDFVLSHYVALGVEELDQAKLTPLLKLKYHDSIPNAVADLGRPDEIGKVFSGFQRYLYAEAKSPFVASTTA